MISDNPTNSSHPEPARDDSGIQRLLDIVATLRGKNGCPWDREQTLSTLKSPLLEETYEVLDAMDSGHPEHHAEELGDLLLQVVLQAQLRREKREFDFSEVTRQIADKLVRRHPHVFGDVKVSGSAQVMENWERIKAREKAESDRATLGGIPRHLPALLKAQRIQGKAARVGFDWARVDDVAGKVDEEWRELREAMAAGEPGHIREELGDLLFALVNLSRFLKVDAEDALQAASLKFMNRFYAMEQRIGEAGKRLEECSLQEMDEHWDAVKRQASCPETSARP